MIQINLLPEEFRPTDGNVLPMAFTFTIGFSILCVLSVYWVVLTRTVTSQKSERSTQQTELAKWREKEKRLNQLIKEIKASQSRQETIIKISSSKIMWSAKMSQLSTICAKFKNVWVESVVVNQNGLKGTMRLNCNLMSDISADISGFNEAIKSNRLFWYHFKKLEISREVRQEAGPKGIPPTHWKFSPTLVLNDEK